MGTETRNEIKGIEAFCKDLVQYQDAAEPLTEDAILGAWQDLAEEERAASRASLASAMLHHSLGMDLPDSTVTFYVSNDAQRDWVREKAHQRLEGGLRQKLKNRNVKLMIQTVVTDGNKKAARPYMPTEKAKVLLAGSEELKAMKEELDLDVEM